MAESSVSCTDPDILNKRKEIEPYENSESISESSESESSEPDDDSDTVRPANLTVTDPDVLKYQKEILAYENANLRKNYIVGVHPCDPEDCHDAISAAKLAIKRFNETEEGESLEYEEFVRSNWSLTNGALYYITFRASNGKFYETKVCVLYNDIVKFYFLRDAKYHPNFGLSSSSSSSSESDG